MEDTSEIYEFLHRHIKSIMENDLKTYHETISPDLTLYEWFVTPHRIDGIAFHDFMMESNSSRGIVFGTERGSDFAEMNKQTRFDFANFQIQRYENTAIASYTLLVSISQETGVKVIAHNESRVMVKQNGKWLVVHCHKSPAWDAPRSAPHP